MRTTLQVLRTAVLLTAVLAVGGTTLTAQGRTRKRSHRIFAAQTGPDQVTLAWDEVPGTTEYRVYLPDPNRPGPPTAASRPYTVLSGSGRQTGVTGVRRMAAGAYLEARKGSQVLYRGTFNAVTRAPLTPVTAPTEVQAQETGETEVTVTWPTVPGATAYMISRAAGGSGWAMACNVCPPTGEFVDTTALPGLEHAYAVAAIFPQGISERTPSNELTVGAAQLAAATAAAQTVAAATWDKPMSSGTPVAGTDGDNTNVGASTGTPTTSTGTPTTGTPTTGTGTPTTGTGTTGTPTGTCPPGTMPITAMPKTSTPLVMTKMMDDGTPVPGTEGDPTNAGAGTGTTTGGTTGTGTSTGGCVPIGTPTTGTGTPTTGTPTTGTGTPGYTPPGTSTGYTPPGTSSGYTPPGTSTGTSTPTTGTPTTGTGSLQPPTQITATGTGVAAGTAWVSWAASPSAGVTGYVLFRSVNGAAYAPIRQVGVGVLGYADTAYTRLMFSQGDVKASYYMVAVGLNGAASGPSVATPQVQILAPALTPLQQIGNTVGQIAGGVAGSVGGLLGGTTAVHQATPTAGATPAPATPPATLPSCKLDYQRADNMWAAVGRPDGALGTETIAEAYGQTKVFITDWQYEKRVNDGVNYYGSHLRIATNTGAGQVALRLNNPTAALFGGVAANIAQKLGAGALAGFVIMKPGDRAEFRDDLREVRCGQ